MAVLTRLFPTHNTRMAAGAATICLLASGCGSKSASPAVPTLPRAAAQSPTSARAGATLAAFRAAIACGRAHGMAGLPDPVLDGHGKVILPGMPNPPAPTPAVQAACGELINRAAALAGSSSNPQPTAADIRALTRFARCMRVHGAPQWPDPDPNHPGQFTFASRADLPPAILPQNQEAKQFFAPCRQFVPATGISIGFSGNS
jgi:hypothetical protein